VVFELGDRARLEDKARDERDKCTGATAFAQRGNNSVDLDSASTAVDENSADRQQ